MKIDLDLVLCKRWVSPVVSVLGQFGHPASRIDDLLPWNFHKPSS